MAEHDFTSSAVGDVEVLPGGRRLQLAEVSPNVYVSLGANGAVPGITPGTVFWYGGSTPPAYALECDGSEYSESTYAQLFTAVGTLHNTGGETAGHFRVPNINGGSVNRFIRGADGTTYAVGATGDDGAPDIDGTTGRNWGRSDGTNSGAFSIGLDGGDNTRPSLGASSSNIITFAASADDPTYSDSISEVRPDFIALLPCIAFTDFFSDRDLEVVPRGHIYGLEMSNGTDASHDLDIAVGECASDDTTPSLMKLETALTGKQGDVTWAAGSSAGASLDSGTMTADGTLHCWLISNGVTVDFAVSDHDTSGLTPTLPSGYTHKQWIGAVTLDGSGNIRAFSQNGDEFLLSGDIQDIAATNPGTAAVTRTLSVPEGVVLLAILSTEYLNGASSPGSFFRLSPLDVDDAVPAINYDWLTTFIAGGVARANQPYVRIRTNTSAQIRSRVSTSNANITLYINTLGWVAPRARIN